MDHLSLASGIPGDALRRSNIYKTSDAYSFGIPLDNVHVNGCSTDKVANLIPTAVSMSTDTYETATLGACHQILVSLEPIRNHLGPDASSNIIVLGAHFQIIASSPRA
jgi:hypothetical protein